MELGVGLKQRRAGWSGALVAAAWLGSLCGMAFFVVVGVLEEPLASDEFWALPIIIVGYGTLFGLPVALLGLLLIGLPATLLLKPWAERRWMPALGFLAGGLAGRVTYHLVDHAIFFGNDDLWSWRVADYGVLIGAPTGLIWFFQARRVLRSQRSASCTASPSPKPTP